MAGGESSPVRFELRLDLGSVRQKRVPPMSARRGLKR